MAHRQFTYSDAGQSELGTRHLAQPFLIYLGGVLLVVIALALAVWLAIVSYLDQKHSEEAEWEKSALADRKDDPDGSF